MFIKAFLWKFGAVTFFITSHFLFDSEEYGGSSCRNRLEIDKVDNLSLGVYIEKETLRAWRFIPSQIIFCFLQSTDAASLL